MPAAAHAPAFGVPLERLARVPPVFDCTVDFILTHCEEMGIFRVPGSSQRIHMLRKVWDTMDEGMRARGFGADEPALVVADLLKEWFRALPASLIPDHLLPGLSSSIKLVPKERDICVRSLIMTLDRTRQYVTRRLFMLLAVVASTQSTNMTANSLAIIFSMTLQPDRSREIMDPFRSIQVSSRLAPIITVLIKHCGTIFSEDSSPVVLGAVPAGRAAVRAQTSVEAGGQEPGPGSATPSPPTVPLQGFLEEAVLPIDARQGPNAHMPPKRTHTLQTPDGAWHAADVPGPDDGAGSASM